MFSIKLYHFDKKPNSTKLPPAGTGDTFMCNIKTSSSLINPVIEIRSTDNSLLTYNYAYIGPFGSRYYFIDDIVFNAGIFSISLSVDVLASYKADILASSQYVQRSASRYNRNIIDTSYLTIANSARQQAGRAVYSAVNKVPYKILRTGEQGNPVSIFNVPLAQGDFVVGILGDNSTGVQWYAMGYPAFGELLRKAFTLTPSNMTDLQQGTANAIFDPISYIVSARWFPRVPLLCLGTTQNTLKIGSETVTLSLGCQPLNIENIPEFEISFTDIPSHPEAASWAYFNLAPYREVNLYFQPFGNFPLDTSKLFKSNDIKVTWSVDFTTATSHMQVFAKGDSGEADTLLAERTSDYGVAVPISALVTDWKTAATTSILSYVGTKAEAITSSGHWDSLKAGFNGVVNWVKNIGNTSKRIPAESTPSVKDLFGKAADVLASAMGQVQTTGTVGSFLSFNESPPYVYTFYYYQGQKDLARFGAPLYETAQLSTLSGFVLCENASVNFSNGHPTEPEAAAVMSALDSGVFLE